MPKSDVQTSLRLPEVLRDRLAQAAAETGHGIGEEMRLRLEASFKPQPTDGDPRTLQFAEAVKIAAANLGRVCAPWHKDPFAFAIFKVAFDTLLQRFQPGGEPVPPPGISADPQPSGWMLAGMVLGALEDGPPNA